jgi:hypothetical protein
MNREAQREAFDKREKEKKRVLEEAKRQLNECKKEKERLADVEKLLK